MRSVSLLIAAALGLAACSTARPPVPTERVGSPLSLELPDLEGRPADIGAAAAGQVLIVDFWASWCDPCREALPAIDGIYARHKERGLVVAGVSVDADLRKVAPFLLGTKVSFPIYWDQGAAFSEEAFHVARIPMLLIVDRRGTIRHVHEGYTGEDEAAKIEEEVLALLAEPR